MVCRQRESFSTIDSTVAVQTKGLGCSFQAAMYFVTRLCDWTLQATAEHFGLTSYGGVSWACAQIRAKQAGERTFRNTLEHIEQQIMQQQT